MTLFSVCVPFTHGEEYMILRRPLAICDLQEHKEDKEEKGVKYHRVERSSSFVKRSIRMPDSADLSNIKVGVKSDLLTIMFVSPVFVLPITDQTGR